MQSYLSRADVEQVETKSDDDNDKFVDDFYLRDTLDISIGTPRCSTLKHVSERDSVSYGKRKLDQVYTVVKDRFSSVLKIEDDLQKEKVACSKKAEKLDRLFLIKGKVTSAKTEEKAKLLTLVPDRWTLKEIEEFFHVSNRIARNS